MAKDSTDEPVTTGPPRPLSARRPDGTGDEPKKIDRTEARRTQEKGEPVTPGLPRRATARGPDRNGDELKKIDRAETQENTGAVAKSAAYDTNARNRVSGPESKPIPKSTQGRVAGGATHALVDKGSDTAEVDKPTRPAAVSDSSVTAHQRWVSRLATSHVRPYETPGRSARNHWRLITFFALVGLLLGAAFGIARPPTYTAESRLVVGKTAQLSNLASTPGLDAAGQSLASSYSRLAATDEVRGLVEKELGRPLVGSLSASPIPLSSVIRLEASAKNEADALAIAAAGSKALVATVDKLNLQQNASSENILKEYQAADKELIEAQNRLDALQGPGGATGSGTLADQIVAAQTEVDAAKVKTEALAATYSGVFNPSTLNSQIIQPVGDAQVVGNNRKSTTEAAVLVGTIFGALLGLGVAVMIDRRARPRT